MTVRWAWGSKNMEKRVEKEGGGGGNAGLKVLESIKRHLVEIGDSRLDCIVCVMLV